MAAVKQIILPVQGMTCAGCVGHVERALKKVGGVTGANVNLATERATVAYDPTQVTPTDLVAAVSQAGYTAVTERVTVPVGGMTCASCVSHVERALKKVDGVVAQALATHPRLQLLTDVVSIKSYHGEVTLTGYVPDQLQQMTAEAVARGVSGVKEVVNTLVVSPEGNGHLR
jgi:Cu+-exporting ATPase